MLVNLCQLFMFIHVLKYRVKIAKKFDLRVNDIQITHTILLRQRLIAVRLIKLLGEYAVYT